MNLKEVMQALIDGKVLLCKEYVYKLHEGNLCFWGIAKKWKISDWNVNYLAKNNCEISETDPEAEYKKSLEPKYGALGFDNKFINFNVLNLIYCGNETDFKAQQGKALMFNEAFRTLIRLKAHPLSVAAVDEKYQYVILQAQEIIDVSKYMGLEFKLDYLSPFFNSEEDARQAIKDIGEERILSMFKVLQGDYDE